MAHDDLAPQAVGLRVRLRWGLRRRLEAAGAAFVQAASLPPGLLLTAAWVLLVTLSLRPLRDESCTFDEGTHLAAGYTYLTEHDYRMSLDNPPLAKVFAALPLVWDRPAWPADSSLWDHAQRYEFAYALLYLSGNDPNRLLFLSRLVTLFQGSIRETA